MSTASPASVETVHGDGSAARRASSVAFSTTTSTEEEATEEDMSVMSNCFQVTPLRSLCR